MNDVIAMNSLKISFMAKISFKLCFAGRIMWKLILQQEIY